MAEGVGFEPTVTCEATMVFKTIAFVRSAIPPGGPGDALPLARCILPRGGTPVNYHARRSRLTVTRPPEPALMRMPLEPGRRQRVWLKEGIDQTSEVLVGAMSRRPRR